MTYSPTNLCSTIGAVGLNFSVRDGKRWIPNAINRLNKGLMPCISYKVKVYSLRFRYGNLVFRVLSQILFRLESHGLTVGNITQHCTKSIDLYTY